MTRRTVLVAVLVAVAAIVVGGLVRHVFFGPESSAASQVSQVLRSPEDTGPAGLPADIDYVALGDSYTAGPLIPDARNDPAGCLRSTHNYPAFLADELGARSYRDVSCSGATTGDLFGPQRLLTSGDRAPAQLEALRPGTDLVTLGIGGNDHGLFGSLTGTCGQLAASDPDGSPCRDYFAGSGTSQTQDPKLRDARQIADNVARAVTGILDRAPHAKVYVIGYPRLLPDSTTCARAGLAAGDVTWANQVERALNESLRQGAQRAGATYVDLATPSRGHDVCAGKAAWTNGKQLRLGVAAPYHPMQRGMRAEAAVIYRAITGVSP